MAIDQYLQIASKEKLRLTPEHYSLVKRTALYLKTRLPANIEVEDLMQSGLEGLMQASSSYDDTRGVTFDQFARTRIRGAMLDEVRRISNSTRNIISNKRIPDTATRHLTQELGRTPRSHEIAEKLEISIASALLASVFFTNFPKRFALDLVEGLRNYSLPRFSIR